MLDRNILIHASVITVMVTVGYCFVFYGHYLAVDPFLKQFGPTKSSIMVYGSIATSIYSCGFCYSLPMWLVLSWITNIRTKFESKYFSDAAAPLVLDAASQLNVRGCTM